MQSFRKKDLKIDLERLREATARERELKADVRTHEGWLQEKLREKWAEDPKEKTRRRIGAVYNSILTRGNKASYTEIKKDTGFSDQPLTDTLKDLERKHKIKRIQDNTKWPPRVYYQVTKKGYEEKRVQRSLFARLALDAFVTGDPATADNIIARASQTTLVILKLLAEDYVKNKERLLLGKRESLDTTDSEDIREILPLGFMDALASAIIIYFLDSPLGSTAQEERDILTQRLNVLSEAIERTLKTDIERKRVRHLHELWQADLSIDELNKLLEDFEMHFTP